jgi:hypothetical protein
MVVVPITAQAFTRNLKTSHSWYHDNLPDVNASTDSIILAWVRYFVIDLRILR